MKYATTCLTTFGPCNAQGEHLFSVQGGIPVPYALENAAHTLECAQWLNEELADADANGIHALQGAAARMMELSKALVEASLKGLIRSDVAG